MWPPLCLTISCKRTLAFVTTFRHKSSESALHNFTMWALSCAKFSGLQRRSENVAQLHSEVVPRAFWRLLSKSCDECKGSFARGCGAKRWSHWTCSSLGTIFQPMKINSVPDVKCFCNNKNVLRAQSKVWHFVRHPVYFVRHPVYFVRHPVYFVRHPVYFMRHPVYFVRHPVYFFFLLQNNDIFIFIPFLLLSFAMREIGSSIHVGFLSARQLAVMCGWSAHICSIINVHSPHRRFVMEV